MWIIPLEATEDKLHIWNNRIKNHFGRLSAQKRVREATLPASNGIMMLRTAEQRKTLCGSCPVARVADLLGDSCSLLVLRDLLEKPRRFSDLQNSLSGISTRTLTNKLKRLENEKLVLRKEFTEPSRIEYTLTRKGSALRDVIDAMRAYGKKYL